MKLSDSSIVDVNNLGEKELNEFVLQCLSLLNNNLNDLVSRKIGILLNCFSYRLNHID